MLTERSILQDVATSDRVISGAKTLLLKYSLCSFASTKGLQIKLDILPTSEHLRICCFFTLLTLGAYPGRSIWMEIVQKLVAVFLVSVVESANGLQLSVAITLMMAATSAMVQPFARPQVRLWAGFGNDVFHVPRIFQTRLVLNCENFEMPSLQVSNSCLL